DYLALDQLLGAQQTLSDQHDELLFVIIHQSSELWMKLVLHELQGALAAIDADTISPALKMLARVGRIQAQMTQAWEILATMTPADYHRFRVALGG
ncbi:MAG: tryptophan 2,3-dioxygenase family protein, partial [Acidocella sp.]|nr:tryptophan 2,3-dioxygenase family protein [Acidocella sp.]